MRGKRFRIMVVLLFMAGMAHHAGCSRTLSVQEKTEIDAVGVQEERGIPDRVSETPSTASLSSEKDPATLNDSVKEVEEGEFIEDELEDEFAWEDEIEVVDPLRGYNEFMTEVNDRIYFWILQPAATGYRAVLPQFIRRGIARAFVNIQFPMRFVNNALQLKFKQAAGEAERFLLNSTIGILGFADPAESWFGLAPHPEDFGQTLGHYGAGGGFHIVLPLLGPSNLRDALGRVTDLYLLDPVGQYQDSRVVTAARVIETVNKTSLELGQYESLRKDAIDLYPFLRDVYEQNRNKQIKE